MKLYFLTLAAAVCVMVGCAADSHRPTRDLPAAAAVFKVRPAIKAAILDAVCAARLASVPDLTDSLAAAKQIDAGPRATAVPPLVSARPAIGRRPRQLTLNTVLRGCAPCKPAKSYFTKYAAQLACPLKIREFKDLDELSKDPFIEAVPSLELEDSADFIHYRKWTFDETFQRKNPDEFVSPKTINAWIVSVRELPIRPPAFDAPAESQIAVPGSATDLLATYLADGPFSITTGKKRIPIGGATLSYGPQLVGELRGSSIVFHDPKPRASKGIFSVAVPQLDIGQDAITARTALGRFTFPLPSFDPTDF